MPTTANRKWLALFVVTGLTASLGLSGTARAATKPKAKTKAKPTTTKAVVTTAALAPVTTAAPTPTPTASAAKITEIQNGSEPATWDPVKLNASAGAHANRMYPLFGALYYMEPKKKQFVGLLADSLDSNDGINWTMKIHPNVKFTDGATFDAAAVKADWERIQDVANASPSRATASQITTMTADGNTLRFTLAQRNFQILWGIQRTGMLYIGSPKVTDWATKPIGAGPFKLKDFKRDDKTVYEPNADWPFWPGGKPNIGELTIKPIIDENQRYNNVVTGQAQLSFTQFSQILDKAKKDGKAWTYMGQEGGNSIIFNTTRSPFDDARLRRALQLSIDLGAYESVNSNGNDDPVHNIFDDDSPFYDKAQDFPKYNLAEAQRLIDSILESTNKSSIDITLGHFTSTANALNASFFQAQWSKLKGLKVTLDGADSPTAQSRVIRGNFGVHLWGNLFTDPDELYEALRGGSSQNWGQYSDKAMDAALNLGRASTTNAERKSAYDNMIRILNFDVPIIWYDRVPSSFIHEKGTSNTVWYYDGILRVDQVKFA